MTYRLFKYLMINFLLFSALTIKSQTKEDFINDKLTSEQCRQLDYIFKSKLDGRQFQDFKVAFFNSPAGTTQHLSADFFNEFNIHKITNPLNIPATLIYFSEKEKSKHGYDVAIIYGSKNLNPKVNRQLIRLTK